MQRQGGNNPSLNWFLKIYLLCPIYTSSCVLPQCVYKGMGTAEEQKRLLAGVVGPSGWEYLSMAKKLGEERRQHLINYLSVGRMLGFS